jgi:septal ring factor EnvC (AmiA/AmiB activator)
MQKFLFVGDECVKIQETADASQGMLAMFCKFFLSCICFFCLPLAIEHLLPLFHSVIAALTSAHARISALEAELKASRQAWESATAAKVSAENAVKAAEAKAKKAKEALNDAEQKQLQWERSIAERLDNISAAGGGKYFPYGLFARACLLRVAIYFFRSFLCGAAEKIGEF